MPDLVKPTVVCDSIGDALQQDTTRPSRTCDAHIAVAGNTVLATFTGTVDAAGVGDFVKHLTTALQTGCERVVLDGTDVDFLGADGLAVLYDVARTLTNRGGLLTVSGRRAVSRPIRATGLDRMIPVFDCLTEAVDAVGARLAAI
jgi:anti-sigma B factor antagonist